MEAAPCCWFVPTVRRRDGTCTVGNGTHLRDGRTESAGSAGDAVAVLDCATHPKEVTCSLASGFVFWETCRAQSHGFLTCSLLLKPPRNGWRKRGAGNELQV